MCNAYTVRPKIGALALDAVVSAEILKLPSPLVRRTGPGVVVMTNPDEPFPEIMRWGFRRPFGDAINNARSDKFTSRTWAEALRLRRCLVPVSSFYEWQHLPGGSKQAYEFSRPDGGWMWIAGLYERTESHGACYATITTEPSPAVMPIHDLMLAVLDAEPAIAFLRGEMLPFTPYAGEIVINRCDSPLKRKSKPPGDDPQAELF